MPYHFECCNGKGKLVVHGVNHNSLHNACLVACAFLLPVKLRSRTTYPHSALAHAAASIFCQL